MDQMRIVVAEPGKAAYSTTVDNSTEQSAFNEIRKMIGGFVQSVSFEGSSEFDLLIHEEGKLIGLVPNRFIYNGKDLAVGVMVVVKADNSLGKWIDMSDQEARMIVQFLNHPSKLY